MAGRTAPAGKPGAVDTPGYRASLTSRIRPHEALSGQYESGYLCCPESNNKSKFTGSIDAAGKVTLRVNVGSGDNSVTFSGSGSADRASITGVFVNANGSSAPITFTR